MRVSNRKCRESVVDRKPFKGSNLEGKIVGDYYVVYSYGWWILYAYCLSTGVWYSNSERYSVSTSRQASQAHPLCATQVRTHAFLRALTV